MPVKWKVGDRIEDHWEILQILQGGMGRVYIVFDHEWQVKLAAKTFQPEILACDPSIKQRFRREALAWIGLDPHPNVVTAILVKNIGSAPFIFLEYEAGGNLRAWIESNKTSQDLPGALRLAVGFCDGIDYAYSKGIKAHRDIKPENCLLSERGELKITNFGLASLLVRSDLASTASKQRSALSERSPAGRLTETGFMLGTIPYMAPEQIFDASNVDARADIYSFGIMLFETLTGELPFVGRDLEEWVDYHVRLPVPSLGKSVPKDVQDLIQECTAKAANKRPANFQIIRDRLSSAYTTLTGMEIARSRALPPHSNRLMRKGIGLADLGEPNAARSFFERSLMIDPNNAPAWLGKSYVLSSLSRDDEALSCTERATALDPQDGKVWIGKALALARLGRPVEALSCAELATSLTPNDWSVWPAKAHMLIALRKNEDAVAACEHALAVYPFAAILWTSKGQALHALQNYEEALRCFDSALEIDPDDSAANLFKGSILVDKRKYEQAIPFLDRCLEADPKSSKAWFCKGVAVGGLGKTQEEVYCLRRCIEIDPSQSDAWSNLSVALGEEGRSDEALSCAEKAVAVGPDNTKALHNLSSILHERGRSDESLVHLDHLLRIARDDSRALNQKGSVLAALGRAQEAQEFFLLAAERGDARAQFNLGLFYSQGRVTKDYEMAIHWYTLAAKNGYSNAQFKLGIMCLRGEGIKQNPCQAYAWLHLAAEGGNAEAAVAREDVCKLLTDSNMFKLDPGCPPALAHAKHNIGVAYYHGAGTTQDYIKALKWFKEAAEMGLADSLYNVGLMYKNGQGTNQDPVEAYFWLNVAALRGDNKAGAVRDSLAATMSAAQLAAAAVLTHARPMAP